MRLKFLLVMMIILNSLQAKSEFITESIGFFGDIRNKGILNSDSFGNIYSVSGKVVICSNDDGRIWQKRYKLIINDIKTISCNSNGIVYLGTNRLMISLDGAYTFSDLIPYQLHVLNYTNIASKDSLVAVIRNVEDSITNEVYYELLYSNNLGKTWKIKGKFIDSYFNKILFDDDGVLFFMNNKYGFGRLDNIKSPSISYSNILYGIEYYTYKNMTCINNNILLLIRLNSKSYFLNSSDKGITWDTINSFQQTFSEIYYYKDYFIGFDFGIYISYNLGSTWNLIKDVPSLGMPYIAITPKGTILLYNFDSYRIYNSTGVDDNSNYINIKDHFGDQNSFINFINSNYYDSPDLNIKIFDMLGNKIMEVVSMNELYNNISYLPENKVYAFLSESKNKKLRGVFLNIRN